MRKFLIVKNGTTVDPLIPRRGDFEAWFAAGMGLDESDVDVVRPYLDEALPDPTEPAGVVLTGSPAMTTDEEDWNKRAEAWLRTVVEARVPTLAICYGHHQLARVLGGRAGWNPNGREMGTYSVELTAEGRDDPLFEGLPDTLDVHESHSQSVLTLPPGARLLAFNAHDPHQGFAVSDHVWSFQFHPEFDADIVRGYIDDRADEIRSEDLDPETLKATTRDSDLGPRLLRRFVELARLRAPQAAG